MHEISAVILRFRLGVRKGRKQRMPAGLEEQPAGALQLANTLANAMPETITYSRLRNQLAKALDKVNEDRAPLLIVRQRGKSAVLLSAEEYSALEETAYLLRSPRNAARLRAAHDEIEKEIARRAATRRRRRTRHR